MVAGVSYMPAKAKALPLEGYGTNAKLWLLLMPYFTVGQHSSLHSFIVCF